jgi:hypothetical protein
MAKITPFSNKECQDVERAARSILNGDIRVPDELKQLRIKWWPWIETFLRCVSKRNGEYLHLPYSGGAMEQPHKTMKVFDVLQNVYVEKIKKDQEAQTAKMKSNAMSRPRRR